MDSRGAKRPPNSKYSSKIGGECLNISQNNQHIGHDVEHRSGELNNKLNVSYVASSRGMATSSGRTET